MLLRSGLKILYSDQNQWHKLTTRGSTEPSAQISLQDKNHLFHLHWGLKTATFCFPSSPDHLAKHRVHPAQRPQSGQESHSHMHLRVFHCVCLCVCVSDLVFGHHVCGVEQWRSDGGVVMKRLTQQGKVRITWNQWQSYKWTQSKLSSVTGRPHLPCVPPCPWGQKAVWRCGGWAMTGTVEKPAGSPLALGGCPKEGVSPGDKDRLLYTQDTQEEDRGRKKGKSKNTSF